MTKLLDYFLRFLAAIATFVVLYMGIGILMKAFLPDFAFSNEVAIGVSLIAAFAVILSRPYIKVAIPLCLIGVIAVITPTLLKGLDINLQTPGTSANQAATPSTANEAKRDDVKQAVEETKKTYYK